MRTIRFGIYRTTGRRRGGHQLAESCSEPPNIIGPSPIDYLSAATLPFLSYAKVRLDRKKEDDGPLAGFRSGLERRLSRAKPSVSLDLLPYSAPSKV
ncbi:hypothetical protein CPLU01_14143 [Colletotrichum plurivorum]|uniref:Uncharacterized protein n=1 Tax=Colletotrichum plurivorum TaxID=2175906 RepID=A0A8H6N0V5_9PEZI|nr:hypothetical protein CPLU01_14143 [Colletotrichum plurivorum]